MQQSRQERKEVLETWMHTHDAIARCWVEENKVTGGTLGGVSHHSG